MTIQKAIEETHEVYSPSPVLPGVVQDAPQNALAPSPSSIEVGINLTDLGNARRFVVIDHGGDLHFCYPWGEWLAWDGQRWKADETGEVNRRAKETVRRMYQEAAGTPDENHRKKLDRRCPLRSESDSKIRAMLSLGQSEPGVPILPEAMDKDPWLLNVTNGTIDLRTGELRPHQRDDLITKMAQVDYIEYSNLPLVAGASQKNHGREYREDLLPPAGLRLFPVRQYRREGYVHPVGWCANGKTVTNETVAMIMGDYSLRTPTETLLQKSLRGQSLTI